MPPSTPTIFPDGGKCRLLYLSSLLEIAADEATRLTVQKVRQHAIACNRLLLPA